MNELTERHRITGKTVLVTGGAGFIGSHLAESLLPDNDVRVIDDLSSGESSNCPDDAELIEGDIRNRQRLAQAMDGIDVVFHLAANVDIGRSVEDPLHDQDVNTAGTLKLLEQAKTQRARVVHASSAAVYGDPASVPIEERDPKEPISPYGASKLASDCYVRLYDDLYDIETVALRYFNVYGPGQIGGDYSGVITKFRRQAAAGEPITVFGDGSQTRDFVHVDDVVRANILAASTPHTGEAFNIGTGTSVEITQLAETIKAVWDSPSEIVNVAPREGDIEHSEASIDKASTFLDFKPRIGLSEGIEALK